MATNSLENKYIATETVIINMKGYWFEITGEKITRHGMKTEETSSGNLVKDHFEPVFGVLYLTHLLKDGEVKESIAYYGMGEEEKKKYEEAPTLDKVLDALCKQLSLMTDGAYDAYYEDCRKRHDGEEGDGWRQFTDLPYDMRMQDIFWHILDLREGRYHGSGNVRYEGRRGIPRIETVGEKLYTKLLDLIWRMDHGAGYQSPEEIEAQKRDEERMRRIIPPVTEL